MHANAGDIRDVGANSASGRFPGEGHGKPLQYSCLKNPTDWKATVPGFAESEVRYHSTAAQSLEVNYPTYHIKRELKSLDKKEKDLITESQSSLAKFERGAIHQLLSQ